MLSYVNWPSLVVFSFCFPFLLFGESVVGLSTRGAANSKRYRVDDALDLVATVMHAYLRRKFAGNKTR